MQKNTLFGIAFFIALGSIFEGFWHPAGRNFCLHFETFWLLGPSWGQDGPQTPPRGLWDRFWIDFGPILDEILINFGQFLDDFWYDFE